MLVKKNFNLCKTFPLCGGSLNLRKVLKSNANVNNYDLYALNWLAVMNAM